MEKKTVGSSNPLVSIVIPVHNCEQYIEKCLNSILQQTYGNLEIITINDGSTDQSKEKIENVSKTDERIKVFNQENKGVSVARKLGCQHATGKYITFIDGDDYIASDYIETFVQVAEETQSDLCVCGYTMVDTNGKNLYQSVPKGQYIRNQHEEYPYRILATWARFYRVDLWEKHNIQYAEDNRETRAEDLPIALLTNAVAKNIQCVKQSGYFYVQHKESARHNMKGLKNYRLPYHALEDCIAYVMQLEETNSKEFFELGIFRVFTTFLFDLGRGADIKKLYEICEFEKRMISTYFVHYQKNPRLKLFSGLEIPFYQRIAVVFFKLMVRLKLIDIVPKVLSCFK